MQHDTRHLDELNELIDHAKKQAGNDTKLAKMLNTTSSRVSDWRHGRKTCQPEDQAMLASIAGFNAIEVLARATVQQYEGTPKGDLLMRALGKGSLAIGAALGSAGASAAAIFSSTPTPSHMAEWVLLALNTMYIMSNTELTGGTPASRRTSHTLLKPTALPIWNQISRKSAAKVAGCVDVPSSAICTAAPAPAPSAS